MEDIVIILAVAVVVIFVLGVGVGLALSQRCKLHIFPSAPPLTPLEEICVVPQSLPRKVSGFVTLPSAGSPIVGITARAVSSEAVAPCPAPSAAPGPKRTGSLEVGEIYRTASALSVYLDEIESRPHIKRLMSMPSLTDPQRIIDANQINPTLEVHMDEIDLQEQVGKGGYGAVYKGTWRGAVVAVKYAVCNVEDAQSLEQSIREVVLSKKMSHPNVVQTYAWTVLTGQEAVGAASMEDGAEVVKAALAKTSTSSLANAVEIVVRPHKRLPGPRSRKETPLLPRIRTTAAKEAREAEDTRASEPGTAKVVMSSITEPSTVESPFATCQVADGTSQGPEKRRSGPLENISPLFERMLLKSVQGPHTSEDAEDVKKNLGFDDSVPARDIQPHDELISIDELLFRDSSVAPSVAHSSWPKQHASVPPAAVSEENSGRPCNALTKEELRVAVPEGPPALQQVESTAFSDVSGCMLSPAIDGDHFSTPAGARSSSGVCPAPPRSFLSRASSLGSRSAAQTPQRNMRVRTPDSFNRHAPPGTSLFDGTEATPQQPARGLQPNIHHLLPRARRRITFDPSLDFSREERGMAVAERRPAASRRQTHPGAFARPAAQPEQTTVQRAHSSSLSAGSQAPCRPEEGETPARPLPRQAPCAMSPLDTDALLAGHTPSTGHHGVQANNLEATTPETVGELELQASQQSISAHSCASFNSNEGFGSPMARRNRRRNSLSLEDCPGRGPSSFRENEAMMVVVMEFCDLQSLHRAITKKVFKPHGKFSKQATYRALLRTAQEIAKGMDYIHSFGIVHGDLKPGNVLLKTHRIDRRGYIAKVSDFGLSKPVNASEGASWAENGLGTMAYTAPETFQEDGIHKASDVYAFGILLWEMHHCREAYEGLMEFQICHGVCDGSLRPEFDADCPKELREITCQCWAQDPGDRPSFKDIVGRLTDIEVAYRWECHHQKPHMSNRSRRGVPTYSPAGRPARR